MQSLKAALDETIAALAKQPDLAGVLWERMLASVILQPLRDDTRMVSLARYDISYQLNEVEVGVSHLPGLTAVTVVLYLPELYQP